MEHRKLYNTERLVSEIISKYELENEPIVKANLRRKIERICKGIILSVNGKEISLWDKSRTVPDGHKKAEHFFTANETEYILNHHELKKYVVNNLSLNSDKLREKLNKETEEKEKYIRAAKQRNAYNKKLTEQAEESVKYDYDPFSKPHYSVEGDFYTQEQAHQEKLFMMVEALFLKYFTPIDEQQLFEDMNLYPYSASDGTDFTPEEMEAFERYEKKAYYKPLDNKD